MVQIVSIAADKEVRRFDITVNNLAVMSMLEGTCSLADEMHCISRRERASITFLPQPGSQRTVCIKRHNHIHQRNIIAFFFTEVIEG